MITFNAFKHLLLGVDTTLIYFLDFAAAANGTCTLGKIKIPDEQNKLTKGKPLRTAGGYQLHIFIRACTAGSFYVDQSSHF